MDLGRLSTRATGRTNRRRVQVLGIVVFVCIILLAGQAATAGVLLTQDNRSRFTNTQNDTIDKIFTPGNTLISVQAFGWFGNNNGEVLIVTPNGTTVWKYDPPQTRVFDAEVTDNRTILVSVATKVPAAQCPAMYRQSDCVHNRVVELAPETNEIIWQYGWYDAFIGHHEIHDADRLPNGQTAIIDMGNNRAFTVNRAGEITWSWNASKHLDPGSDFRQQYGGPERTGPESDWTHMNDIDRLPNGNFQLSIRNFNVVLEVDPQTNKIVEVIGRPGNTSILKHQHNPQRLNSETLLVADSENNRIVEIDISSGTVIWAYDASETKQSLVWPRDADRLPNGNTLITDSRNFRVLEITPNGTVVWQYSLYERRGIVYEADRLGVPEEPTNVPTHRSGTTEINKQSGTAEIDGQHPLRERLLWLESWAGFVFPKWVRLPELCTIFVGLIAGSWLALELGIGWLRNASGL
jgi:outer membrane protein assembly factor BamB